MSNPKSPKTHRDPPPTHREALSLQKESLPPAHKSVWADFWEDVLIYLRICYQFWRGFYFLRGTKKAITIFGSARLPDDHPYYEEARKTSAWFGKNGFTVMTGGGPSIMQAANEGAYKAGAASIGINIEIAREQDLNAFTTLGLKCRYFFVRKVLLCRYSEAFVVFPGGFGTLDEYFELITLIQTKKMVERPVVLVGTEFWQGLYDWMKTTLIPVGMINEAELGRIVIVKDADAAIQYLEPIILRRATQLQK